MFKIESKIQNYEVVFNEYFFVNPGDVILMDAGVYKIYPQLTFNYKNTLLITANEEAKGFDKIQKYIDKILGWEFKKSGRLIAIGGGVIQDITGFIASVLFRGVTWYFVPTTLLSQADSCIGGKTSINFKGYKNLIGTFYPPEKIFLNVSLLKTLPENQIRSGLGEILHYYIVSNADQKITQLHADYEALLNQDEPTLLKHIQYSLELKKKVIEADEFDTNQRIIFNYGHTFGHAMEALSGFTIPHGIAVNEGMRMANYLAYKREFINQERYSALDNSLFDYTQAISKNKFGISEFLFILSKDKKAGADHIHFILPHDGTYFKKTAIKNDGQLKADIQEYFKESCT